MIRSTIVPMYYKDYFVNFAPEPLLVVMRKCLLKNHQGSQLEPWWFLLIASPVG